MSEFTTHREESFRYELLDLNDNVLSELDGVAEDAGELEFNIHADIRGSGNLALWKVGSVDWAKHRVRVSYVLGSRVEPLITAIPKAPVEEHSDTGVSVKVELYDKTLILADDSFLGSYGVAAGSNVLSAVRSVIASTGESGVLIGESSAVLSSGMVWEAGVSKLKVVNDLLAAAGFFALYCDGLGRFRADPYVEPSSRGVSWTFADDENGLYLASFSRDRDTFSVPNRFVCVGKSEGNVAALVAVASDYFSPFGFNNVGRWITRTETDVEAVSQAVLDQIAGRRLSEVQQVTETFEIEHPWLPFGLNALVSFSNSRLAEPVRAVVPKQVVKLVTGGLVTSTLRRVS